MNKKNDIRAKVQWCLAISEEKGIDLEAQLTDTLFDYITQNYRSVDSIKEAVGDPAHTCLTHKHLGCGGCQVKQILERLGIK